MNSVVENATGLIRKRWPRRPRFGIVLGTGAAEVVKQINVDDQIAYSEINGFPQSTALGHAGQWICGELAGQPVIAMQGRFHFYEGYTIGQITLPIETMKCLGVEILLVSNAAGGINPYFRAGDLMVIDSHLDFMFRDMSPPSGKGGSAYYDPELIQFALQRAGAENFALHRGVYAAMPGPTYETRAEYRFLRKVGADAVGMSTVPEVITVRRLGMRVLAISIIGNIANPDALTEVTGQNVIDAATAATPRLCALFIDSIERNSQPQNA